MKIARIETIPLAIPHEHDGPPPSWGGQAWEALNILLVRVETDDGAIGWGEAFSYNCMPAVRAMIDATVAPILIGRDAARVTSLMREAQQALHLFGRYGITIFAISAVDIALWDITAKRAGLPLGQLLGGSAAPPLVPGYASLLKYGDRRARRIEGARRARRRLPGHQAPRDGGARGGGGTGGDGRRSAAVCRHQLSVDASPGARDCAPAEGPRSALARGADLPAGGLLRARAPAARIRDRSRLRRERLHRFRVPEHARRGGGTLRAAERDQGGRRHRVPQGARARRSPRRHGDAPLALLRPGLARDLARSLLRCRLPGSPAGAGSSASTPGWRRPCTRTSSPPTRPDGSGYRPDRDSEPSPIRT